MVKRGRVAAGSLVERENLLGIRYYEWREIFGPFALAPFEELVVERRTEDDSRMLEVDFDRQKPSVMIESVDVSEEQGEMVFRLKIIAVDEKASFSVGLRVASSIFTSILDPLAVRVKA